MAVEWDESKYQSAFRVHVDWNTVVGYGAQYYAMAKPGDFSKRMAQLQVRNLLAGNKTHLVIGCGFGYLMDMALAPHGVEVWGTDLSQFIHDNKAVESPNATIASRILQIDVTSPTAQVDFYAAGAGNRTGQQAQRGKFSGLIVSELVIESFNTTPDPLLDVELFAFLNACDALSDNGAVWHFVATLPAIKDPDLRHMTLEQWRDLRPAHYWCSVNDFEADGSLRVLGGA